MIWCDWYDTNNRKISRQIQTTVKQLLVMVKSILYEGTIALGTGVDFGKGLGRSEPWGNYCGSGWRKETVETRGRIHDIAEKKHETDFLYEKPANWDLHKTAWINMAFRGVAVDLGRDWTPTCLQGHLSDSHKADKKLLSGTPSPTTTLNQIIVLNTRHGTGSLGHHCDPVCDPEFFQFSIFQDFRSVTYVVSILRCNLVSCQSIISDSLLNQPISFHCLK